MLHAVAWSVEARTMPHRVSLKRSTYNETSGDVVVSRGFGEFDAAGVLDSLDELRREVAPGIAPDCPWEPVAREEVVGEKIENLLARRVPLDRDGFDPSQETISEHYELGVASGSLTDVGRHVEDVAHQTVEGVGAHLWREAPALAAIGALGKGALVAAQHVASDVVEHLRPVDHASHRLVGGLSPAVVALSSPCSVSAFQAAFRVSAFQPK